jgi:hypothetical protein
MQHMKRTLFFSTFALGILVLALGGWTVQGLRRALTVGRRPATA